MKGAIKPDHISVSKYELKVLGVPIPLTFTEISGIESETTVVELPDRTQASGGEEMVGEFTAMMPMHHVAEVAVMDAWLQEGRDPVLPTYKKVGTMLWKSISGETVKSRPLSGLFVSKRADPDAEMGNDGEMAQIEWTFKYDSALPLV